MAEIQIGQIPNLIPDMMNLGVQVYQQRKGILREKQHLKLTMQGVINTLMKMNKQDFLNAMADKLYHG